jgi:hypothetical protein
LTGVDSQQDARLDRLDARVRALEELAHELRAVVKLAKPIMLMAAASLGVDIMPLIA